MVETALQSSFDRDNLILTELDLTELHLTEMIWKNVFLIQIGFEKVTILAWKYMKQVGACTTGTKGGSREEYKSSIQVLACTKNE